MRQDPFLALENHYAGQPQTASHELHARLTTELEAEMQEFDFAPAVTGLRRVLPLAAAIAFGVLTPSVSREDVRNLAASIEQSQTSSVLTELETPWED
jgi:hypothetical protein